jgi:hypothetical protein
MALLALLKLVALRDSNAPHLLGGGSAFWMALVVVALGLWALWALWRVRRARARDVLRPPLAPRRASLHDGDVPPGEEGRAPPSDARR